MPRHQVCAWHIEFFFGWLTPKTLCWLRPYKCGWVKSSIVHLPWWTKYKLPPTSSITFFWRGGQTQSRKQKGVRMSTASILQTLHHQQSQVVRFPSITRSNTSKHVARVMRSGVVMRLRNLMSFPKHSNSNLILKKKNPLDVSSWKLHKTEKKGKVHSDEN